MMWRTSAIVLVRVAAIAAAVYGIDRLCVDPYRGNLLMHDIERRTTLAQTLDATRATSLAHANMRDLAIAGPGRRLDPEWYLLYGANCETLGRWEAAVDAYTQALQIDDRPEIYVTRGMAMLHMGHVDTAIADLATAARFDPKILDDLDGELRARVTAAARVR